MIPCDDILIYYPLSEVSVVTEDSESQESVTYVPLPECHLCRDTISNLLFYMLLSLLVQKKVTKETHPEKPLLAEFVRSFEEFGPRLNSLRSTPLKQNPLSPPNFSTFAHWLLRGPVLRAEFHGKGENPDDFRWPSTFVLAVNISLLDIEKIFHRLSFELSQLYTLCNATEKPC